MADRDSASQSEFDSDASSMDGSAIIMRNAANSVDNETLIRRIEQLQQDNRALRVEVETSKLKIRSLTNENRDLRLASVTIQQKAEQEEEFISNTLLKKIQALKKEKESLAINFEQEEESLTNDLQRKLNQLRSEKIELESAREREQECQVNKLMRRIEKLESDVDLKQRTLEQLRREKIELENTLEQEQEALVNRLWKKMEHSEAEKRMLGARLEAIPAALQIYANQITALQSGSAFCAVPQAPAASASVSQAVSSSGTSTVHYAPVCAAPSHPAVHARMSTDSVDQNEVYATPSNPLPIDAIGASEPRSIDSAERDVVELKRELYLIHAQAADRIAHLEHAEHLLVDENLRLRKRLQMLELDRSRASLNRHHSESESSLEAGVDQPSSDTHGHMHSASRSYGSASTNSNTNAQSSKERSRNVSNPCPSPMNLDRPGSAGPIPMRCVPPPVQTVPGPTVSLAVQAGSQPTTTAMQVASSSGQNPSLGALHHDTLQLQLVANFHVSAASQQSPIGPPTSATTRGSFSQPQLEVNSTSVMPRVCRECGAQLVVYVSSMAGHVSGTANGGAPTASGSARASLSSLTGLLVPTPPGSALPNAFRD